MAKNPISHLIESRGPDLFRDPAGVKYIRGAIVHLRHCAVMGHATLRIPAIRDLISAEIRRDIIRQATIVAEHVGQAELMLMSLEDKGLKDEQLRGFFCELLAGVYAAGCDAEDSLRRLCKITVETYWPKDVPYNPQSRETF